MIDAAPASGPSSRSDEMNTPRGAGERLRAAREAQGLSLADIAARTRVPIRHLEAIEAGDYSEMPTPTYAVGFAKAYARAVGEDEVTIARDVRGQTAAISAERQNYQPYELDDPTRVPPRGVAMVAAAIAVVVLIVAAIWFGTDWFRPGSDTGTPIAAEQAQAPAETAPQAVARMPVPVLSSNGQVELTALDRVWVRVHDASGKTLFEGTMKAGDKYDVPADANHPALTVGRPHQLQVTVDGTRLAPLGSGARPMKDVPIDAGSLAARQTAASTPAAPAASSPPTAATPAAAAPSPTPSASAVAAAKPTPRATPKAKATPKPRRSPSHTTQAPTQPPPPVTTGIY
ncbi:MAG: helix-turn-helix domain-containing protein [Sphingomonas sp.]